MPPDMEEMRNPIALSDPRVDSACASPDRTKAGVATLRTSVACCPWTDPSGVAPKSRRSEVTGGCRRAQPVAVTLYVAGASGGVEARQ